ncbi:Uncharacterised protein [Mycobacteroides abscessus subsp. abscessus]|nr:Uncharacterised protein [Mycobacteroides abscessus subsp. abscessus]
MRIATPMIPCGARASVKAARPAAMAAGNSLRVARVCSAAHHVSSEPNTMIPSGRRPEQNGSQNAVKTSAADHCAQPLRRIAEPSRGNRIRLSTNHEASPAISAGMCIHRIDGEIDDQWARNE